MDHASSYLDYGEWSDDQDQFSGSGDPAAFDDTSVTYTPNAKCQCPTADLFTIETFTLSTLALLTPVIVYCAIKMHKMLAKKWNRRFNGDDWVK